MKRLGYPSLALALLVVGCAHGPVIASPLYTASVPGDESTLTCLASSLEAAGFDLDPELTDNQFLARRNDSAAFDGSLHATYVARATVETTQTPELVFEVAISDDEEPRVHSPLDPSSSTASTSGQSRIRSAGAYAERQQRMQARAVLQAEFDPMVDRCAGDQAKR